MADQQSGLLDSLRKAQAAIADWDEKQLQDLYADWDLTKYIFVDSSAGDLVTNAMTGKPTAAQVIARGGSPKDETSSTNYVGLLVILIAVVAAGFVLFIGVEAVK